MRESSSTESLDRDRFYRLYMAEESYFSAKVRPAFRWKRIPHLEILATNRVYREVIVPRIGFAMIPVVVDPAGETLQDSSDILDALESRYPVPPLFPATPVQRAVAYLWELYCDEFMMLPGLHYRWNFPESEAKARAEFAAISGDTKRANKFADVVKGFTSLVGASPLTAPAVEAHTRELLGLLEAHFAEHPYLLGSWPSLADCALFGPMYAHLFNDAVPGRMLRETAPGVCHWISRLLHPDPDVAGAWLPDDALAPTMRPLLELIGRDAVPVTLGVARAFETWADSHAGSTEELPRVVGMHASSLRGIRFERVTTPYTLFMVQRVRGVYVALDARGRAAVDRALAGTGCEAALAYQPRHRVERRPFKLYLAAK
jgi:glutathione S-transferase